MFRPFRAWDVLGHRTQGVALGYRSTPCWGFRLGGTKKKPTPGGRGKNYKTKYYSL